MVSHSNRNRRRPATGAASQTWNTPTGATMSIMNRNRTILPRPYRAPSAPRRVLRQCCRSTHMQRKALRSKAFR